MMIKNVFGHLHTINKHRWLVFKLCVKAGIPFQGLVHDLSKYSPVEFFESVKYYSGDKSPIPACKKENGYSKAWIHHKNNNKHHAQYWYDELAPQKAALIPYKYTVEMICDSLAAGMTYQKDKWTKDYQLNYYLKKEHRELLNPIIDEILVDVFTRVSKEGLKVINKKELKQIYNDHIRGDKNDKKYKNISEQSR